MSRPIEEVQTDIRALLFTTPKQRRELGLPTSAKEVLREVCHVIWDHLKERGRVFFANGQGYVMCEDNIPIVVSHDGVGFSYLLETDYLISPGLKERKDIGLHVGMMCESEGRRVQFRVGSHYDTVSNTVYIAEKRGWILRIPSISKGEVTRVENGKDDQFFLFPDGYQEWEIGVPVTPADRLGQIPISRPDAGLTSICGPLFPFEPEESLAQPSVFDDLLFAGMQLSDSLLTTHERKLLIKAYIVTLFMRGVTHEHLLFLLLGPTGSGKTYLARVLGKMLQGSGFEVVGLDEDTKELENKLVNNTFVALDDPSGLTAKSLSLIKRAVTGGKMQRRNLYTTAQQIEMPYIAAIAMTTVSQPFHNEEETNRQLCITLAKRVGGYRSEDELLKEVMAGRDLFLWEMVGTITEVLEALEEDKTYTGTVSMRLAGFAILFIKIMRHEARTPEEGEELARSILDRWKMEQESSIFANDDLAEALQKWMTTAGFHAGEQYTAGDLLQYLAPHWRGRPYWSDSSLRLGLKLKASEGSFEHMFGLVVSTDAHTKANRYAFNPSDVVPF
jgi:hypothetical protein